MRGREDGCCEAPWSDAATSTESSTQLLAISDLHVEVPENRAYVESLAPDHDDDWLIVCGDVADRSADVWWALDRLARSFRRVVWVPGNHELWTCPDDPIQLKGEERYADLVEQCRERGILTPEDQYPILRIGDEEVLIAPLFTLYDYSFAAGAPTLESEMMCTDELLLDTHPYRTIVEWCEARVRYTRDRLSAAACGKRSVLINHFPLRRRLTARLARPAFARWCGTLLTEDWHQQFDACAVVCGHLHMPSTSTYDGVRFHEVSLGYPRQWRGRRPGRPALRRILPAAIGG